MKSYDPTHGIRFALKDTDLLNRSKKNEWFFGLFIKTGSVCTLNEYEIWFEKLSCYMRPLFLVKEGLSGWEGFAHISAVCDHEVCIIGAFAGYARTLWGDRYRDGSGG